MKISTALDHGVTAGLTYDEAAKAMKEAGFEGIDLAMCKYQMEPEKLLTDEWFDDVVAQADAAKNAGLEIPQCHLPYYPGHLDNPGNGTVQEFIDFMVPSYLHGIKAAVKVGCPVCVTHPLSVLGDKEKTIGYNIEVIRKLVPMLEDNGIKLAIENCFARRNAQYQRAFIEEKECIMEMIDGIGSENVGACIDTGHANIFRFNISEMARYYGDKLFALHVNSNAGHDEHSIPYAIAGWCERMDFEDFTRTLNEIGFKGYYNLEITGGRFPKQVAPLFYNYAAGMARYLADVK